MPFTNSDLAKREADIRALQSSGPERRCMALGPHYKDLQLTPEAFAEVEEKLRVARLFEVTTMAETMRAVEIDEQRRLVMERRSQEADLKERWLEELHRLRERAYEVLVHDAEAVKLDEQRRLEADRRAVLNIERGRITEKREQFEISQTQQSFYGGGGNVSSQSRSVGGGAARGASASSYGRATSPAAGTTSSSLFAAASGGGGALPLNPNKAPLLVMNITLGNGREDKLTVRANDDPKRVAVLFAKKHRLPDAAINNLTTQIRAHLNARTATAVGGVSSGGGATSSAASMSGGAGYGAAAGGGGGSYNSQYVDSRAPSHSPAPSTGYRSQAYSGVGSSSIGGGLRR